MFPGNPEFQVEKPSGEATQEGGIVQTKYIMHLIFGGYDYRIAATVIPDDMPLNIDVILNQVQNQGMKGNLQLLDQRPIATPGLQGADLVFKSKDKWFVKMRVFVRNKKYFQVIAVVPPEGVNSRETEDFLASVQP